MAIVFIGIGSNLGNREANCLRAIEMMEERGLLVSGRSRMHETEPWGVKKQPRFINMAVSVETDIEPRRLMELLKEIEKLSGRKETVRYGPRTLDLDILLYGSRVLKEPGLEVPHPHMHERSFVLVPLAEIAQEVVHPVLKKTIRELRDNLVKGA